MPAPQTRTIQVGEWKIQARIETPTAELNAKNNTARVRITAKVTLSSNGVEYAREELKEMVVVNNGTDVEAAIAELKKKIEERVERAITEMKARVEQIEELKRKLELVGVNVHITFA